MIRWTLATLLAAVLAVSMVTSSYAEDDPPLVQGLGVWPLSLLGNVETVVPGDAQRTLSQPLLYRLPTDAVQGGPHWFRLNLHLAVTFRDAPHDGVNVSAAVNGCTSALFTFEGNSPSEISWSSNGLVDGPVSGTGGRSLDIHFSNYIQSCGVAPGLNRLEFIVEQPGGGAVDSVAILGDSSLEVTLVGPPSLKLEVALPDRINEGSEFLVEYTLVNSGLPALGVVVSIVTVDPASFVVLGEQIHRYETLDTLVTGRFMVRAEQAGLRQLAVVTDARAGNPTNAEINIAVAAKRSRLPTYAILVGSIAVAVTVILAAVVVRRRGSGSSIQDRH